MLRRSFRVGLWLGLLGGAAVAILRALQRRPEPVAPPWPPASPWPSTPTPEERVVEPAAPEIVEPEPALEPEPAAAPEPAKAARKAAKAAPRAAKVAKMAAATETPAPEPEPEPAPAPWVDPEGGICPASHPVKAKLASKLFHLPGMFAYARTNPDRCYLDEGAAEADGFSKAKR